MRTYSFRFRLGCVVFILSMLLISWEYDRFGTVFASGEIPEDSVRLRILAHSDAPYDQWLKNEVKEAIVRYMEMNPPEENDIRAARQQIESRIPELEQVVGDVIRTRGGGYAYEIALGPTEFPAKMYGRTIYPAGEYEALKITIGSGKGSNWWCVLFPPLCFVDMASGDSTEQEGEPASDGIMPDTEAAELVDTDASEPAGDSFATSGPMQSEHAASSASSEIKTGADAERAAFAPDHSGSVDSVSEVIDRASDHDRDGDPDPNIEVRFWLWDLLAGWFA